MQTVLTPDPDSPLSAVPNQPLRERHAQLQWPQLSVLQQSSLRHSASAPGNEPTATGLTGAESRHNSNEQETEYLNILPATLFTLVSIHADNAATIASFRQLRQELISLQAEMDSYQELWTDIEQAGSAENPRPAAVDDFLKSREENQQLILKLNKSIENAEAGTFNQYMEQFKKRTGRPATQEEMNVIRYFMTTINGSASPETDDCSNTERSTSVRVKARTVQFDAILAGHSVNYDLPIPVEVPGNLTRQEHAEMIRNRSKELAQQSEKENRTKSKGEEQPPGIHCRKCPATHDLYIRLPCGHSLYCKTHVNPQGPDSKPLPPAIPGSRDIPDLLLSATCAPGEQRCDYLIDPDTDKLCSKIIKNTHKAFLP